MKHSVSFFSAIMLAGLTLFSSCSSKGNRTLYLYNWTYYTPESLLRKFEQEFDCKVKLDCYSTCEEMYSKIRGGAKGYDIVIPSNDFVSIMMKQGMLRELDQSKLSNRDKINPVIMEKLDHDPDMKYAVPYALSATGIIVNKAKVGDMDYARDYSIFADPRFAGHATMMDEMREVIGCALLQKGYDMNSTDEAQLDDAVAMIIEQWRPNLVKFDAESFGKSFASGDFWLCQGYPEIVYGELSSEKWADTIDFFIPEQGSPATVDCMCILKDSAHYELANEFINFIHRPENYAVFIDEFGYPCVVNLEAQQYTTRPAMYDAEQAYSCSLKQDLGADMDLYSERWQKIRFAE